ncbi:uncharacterized protein ACBT57_011714 isoform 1-T1 [Dama dama]
MVLGWPRVCSAALTGQFSRYSGPTLSTRRPLCSRPALGSRTFWPVEGHFCAPARATPSTLSSRGPGSRLHLRRPLHKSITRRATLDTDVGGTRGQRLEEPMSGQPTPDPAQRDTMPVGAMQANSSAPEPTRPKRASW